MDKKLEAKMKAKIDDNVNMTGAIRPNPKYCKTCLNSHGEPPFADKPDKANCRAYTTFFKPKDVLFNGAECQFYIKENNNE